MEFPGEHWPHRMSWDIFPPSLFSERVYEGLVLFLFKCFIEFTN